jgi:putative membrane protein
MTPHPLATLNASLNALATILLVVGFVLIKQGRVAAHRRTMLATFAVSTIFLISYLIYHYLVGSVKFTAEGLPRTIYLSVLLSHAILAVFVPFLAIWTIWLGLKDRRVEHRKWAKITFPIWLYVSITGVVIYVMLYLLYPPVVA